MAEDTYWQRKMRHALEGGTQNPFGLEGADAQRAQLEVLSEGMDEVEPKSLESIALLDRNTRKFRGEPSVDKEVYVKEILRRFEAGTLTAEDEALARPIVEDYVRNRGAAPGPEETADAPPPEAGPEPEATQGPSEINAAPALEGFGVDPTIAKTVAENPAARFLTGVGRNVSQHVQGVKQWYKEATGDVAGAKQLAEEETRAAKQWEKFDEGLGAEDVGEATLMAATLLLPGGLGAVAPKTAMKAGQTVLGKLAKTVGGTAVASGIAEATKVTEADENRYQEALQTAGLTFVGGHGLGAASRILSNSTTNGFIARALGLAAGSRVAGTSAHREVKRGIARRVTSMFLGGGRNAQKVESGLTQESRRALTSSATLQQRAVLEGAKSAAKGKEGPVGNAEWKEYTDLINGFRRAARTQTKKAKELGISRAAEADAIKASLLNGSFKTSPDGLPIIDGAEVSRRWAMLQEQPKFKELFGAGNTGKQIKAMDEFVHRIVNGPSKPNASAIYDLAAARAEAIAQRTVDQIESAKIKPEVKKTLIADVRKATVARVMAVVQDSELGSDEVAQTFAQEDGMFNIMDFWGTIDEKLMEAQ